MAGPIETAYLRIQAKMGSSWRNLGNKFAGAFSSLKKSALSLSESLDPARTHLINLKKAQTKLDSTTKVSAENMESLRLGHQKVGKFVDRAKAKTQRYSKRQKTASKIEKARRKEAQQYSKTIQKQTRLKKEAYERAKSFARKLKESQKIQNRTGRAAGELGKRQQRYATSLQTSVKRIKNYRRAISKNQKRMKKAQSSAEKMVNYQKTMEMRRQQASESLWEVAGAYAKVAGRRAAVASIGMAISGAAIAAWSALAMAAGTLNWQMAEVATILSEKTRPALESLETSVVALSNEFGYASRVTSKALYQILSAQIDVANAAYVMETAAGAARAGFVQMSTAADALTTIMNAYHMPATKAEKVSDLLFMTVRKGKTTFRELAAQIGRVAAQGSLANIVLEDLFASVAVMTQAGIKSSVAMTSLTAMLRNILEPSTDAAATAMLKFGTRLGSAGLKAKGLIGIIRSLKGANATMIRSIFSSQRAFRGASALVENLTGLNKTYQSMLHATGTTQSALREVTGKLTLEMKRLWTSLKNLMAVLGEAMGSNELLSSIIGGLSDAISDLSEYISSLQGEWAGTLVNIGLLSVAFGGLVIVVGSLVAAVTALVSGLAPLLAAVGTSISAIMWWTGVAAGGATAAGALTGAVYATKEALEGQEEALKDNMRYLDRRIQQRKEMRSEIKRTIHSLKSLRESKNAVAKQSKIQAKENKLLAKAKRLNLGWTENEIDSNDKLIERLKELSKQKQKLRQLEERRAKMTRRKAQMDFRQAKATNALQRSNMYYRKQLDSLTHSFKNAQQAQEAYRKGLQMVRGDAEKVAQTTANTLGSLLELQKESTLDYAIDTTELKQARKTFERMAKGGVVSTEEIKEARNILLEASNMTLRPTTKKQTQEMLRSFRQLRDRSGGLADNWDLIITTLKSRRKMMKESLNHSIKMAKIQATIDELSGKANKKKKKSAKWAQANLSTMVKVLQKMKQGNRLTDIQGISWKIIQGFHDKINTRLSAQIQLTKQQLKQARKTNSQRQGELKSELEKLKQRKKSVELAYKQIKANKEALSLYEEGHSKRTAAIKQIKEALGVLKDRANIRKKLDTSYGDTAVALKDQKKQLEAIQTRYSTVSRMVEKTTRLNDQQRRIAEILIQKQKEQAVLQKKAQIAQSKIDKMQARGVKKSNEKLKALKAEKKGYKKRLKQMKDISKEQAIQRRLSKKQKEDEKKQLQYGAKRLGGMREFLGGPVSISFKQEEEKETADNTRAIKKNTSKTNKHLKDIKEKVGGFK